MRGGAHRNASEVLRSLLAACSEGSASQWRPEPGLAAFIRSGGGFDRASLKGPPGCYTKRLCMSLSVFVFSFRLLHWMGSRPGLALL